MAICPLCNKPAGLFRKHHKECIRKRDEENRNRKEGVVQISDLLRDLVTERIGIAGVNEKIQSIRESCLLSGADVNNAIVRAWEASAEHFLEDGILSAVEEKNLTEFAAKVGLTPELLNSNGLYDRVRKSTAIRDVLEGRLPNRESLSVDLPFNFQTSESLVWAFGNVDYLADRTKTSYEGRSQGVSIRIASGLYYRLGAFKGHPVERVERNHVDTGALAITTRHLYFGGSKKSIRIRHDKIVSITPYSDGVAIHRDGVRAMPEIFVTGDGWFIHNILANAPHINPMDFGMPANKVERGILGTKRRG